MQQILLALERHRIAADFERNLTVFGAVDLAGLEGLDVSNGLGDARLEFGDGLLVVFPRWHFDAGEPRGDALREVCGDLHLTRQREHVSDQPRAAQRHRVDFLGRAMGLSLVEYARQSL